MEGMSPKGVQWMVLESAFLDKVSLIAIVDGETKSIATRVRHDPDWGWLAELTPPSIPSTLTHQDLGALVDGAIELHANPAYQMDAQRRV